MRWILLMLFLGAVSIFMEYAWGVSSVLFWMLMLATIVFLIIYGFAHWLGREVCRTLDKITEK